MQVKKALGVPEDYKMGPMSGHKNIYNKDNPFQINNRAFLKVVQRDIIRDICGNLSPMSGISYINLLAMFMMVFKAYELKGQHIKLVRDAFTVTRGRKEFPCITLVTYTITTMDEQLLRFLADNMVDAAEHLGCGEFSYWPAFVNIWDLENTLREEKLQECPDSPHEMSNQCSVM